VTTVLALADWCGVDAPIDLLGPAERTIARRFPLWRRREWIIGRLTAHAAAATTGLRPAGAQILTDPTGAPRLVGLWRKCRLSISHTGQLVACLVTDEAAAPGVDVERIDVANIPLLPRITVGREHTTDAKHATTMWACKEAAIKACRRGPFCMRNYHVRLDCSPIVITTTGSEMGLSAWIFNRPERHVVLATVGRGLPRPHPVELAGGHVVSILRSVTTQSARHSSPRKFSHGWAQPAPPSSAPHSTS
jgi:hypothetical protein